MPDVIPNSQGAPSVSPDPVAMISAMLSAEKVTPDVQAQPKQPVAQPEGEAQPETDAEYQPENNAQPEGDEPEPQKADTAEIPLDQLEAIELEVTYKTEGGKDVTEKLPIKALRDGYMKHEDYKRKTAELARERDQISTAVRQGIETERTAYATKLENYKQALVKTALAEFQNVNFDELSETNPAEYVRLQNRYNKFNATLQSIDTEQTALKTKQEAEKRQADTTAAQKAWSALESDIPGWNAELYQKTMKSAEAYGFNLSEAASWTDARLFKMLHKANQYDQLKVGKPPASKKIVVAPKAIRPGSTQTATPQAQVSGRAFERLQKTGNLDSLTAFLSTKM